MDKIKYKSKGLKKKLYIKPLNICVKYTPPTLGIYYEYIGNSKNMSNSKNYIHQIQVIIDSNTNLEELYDSLYNKEPHYFNIKYLAKDQVIKHLENIKNYIIMKERNTQRNNNRRYNTVKDEYFLENKEEMICGANLKSFVDCCLETQCTENMLSEREESSKYSLRISNPSKVTPIKPKLRTENYIINQYEESANKCKVKRESLKEKISKLSNRSNFINQSIFWKKRKLSEDPHNLNKEKYNQYHNKEKDPANYRSKTKNHRGKTEINIDEILNVNPFAYRIKRKPLIKQKENPTKNSGELLMSDLNIYSKINETLNNLQKVFVEDLGREFLMDTEGNLFDEKGEFIGQAEIDDIDLSKCQKGPSAKNNDLKENSV